MGNFLYYLIYPDKIKIWRVTFFKNFLPLRNYEMDLRFSRNSGFMTCTCNWDELVLYVSFNLKQISFCFQVTITLSTHDVEGLSEKDAQLALFIDRVYQKTIHGWIISLKRCVFNGLTCGLYLECTVLLIWLWIVKEIMYEVM